MEKNISKWSKQFSILNLIFSSSKSLLSILLTSQSLSLAASPNIRNLAQFQQTKPSRLINSPPSSHWRQKQSFPSPKVEPISESVQFLRLHLEPIQINSGWQTFVKFWLKILGCQNGAGSLPATCLFPRSNWISPLPAQSGVYVRLANEHAWMSEVRLLRHRQVDQSWLFRVNDIKIELKKVLFSILKKKLEIWQKITFFIIHLSVAFLWKRSPRKKRPKTSGEWRQWWNHPFLLLPSLSPS